MPPIDCTGRGGRGCGCAFHHHRREYHREHARRQRQQRLQERNRTAATCQRRHGQGMCGAVLETVVLAGGRTAVVCPLCERRKRGICRDCPAPVEGRVGTAVRCAVHKECARRVRVAQHRERNKDEIRRRHRQLWREQRRRKDERDQRRLEYNRAWRKANRDKIRAQKRSAALRQSPRVLEYMREYRERRRAEYAEQQRQRYYGKRPLRTCLTPGCEIVVTGRKKKCGQCKAREAEAAARLLAQVRGRGRRTDIELLSIRSVAEVACA